MKQKKIYKVISLLFVFVMLFLSVPSVVFAEKVSDIERMSSSDVVEDLETMKFDLSKYPQDLTADYITILDFVEFGFDFSGNTSRYALYVYIYNPSCREIDIKSLRNTIQIQTSTAAGIGSGYRKYILEHCDHTTDEGKEFLFYKFKIDVPQSYMNKPTKVNRIYEIADIDIFYKDASDPESFGAGGKWTYTGYQAYCGVNPSSSVSTLSYAYEELFTLKLDLNPATWKTNTSEKGEGYRYELFSVYFSVPNWVIEKYGNKKDILKGLYSVQGSYTEYKLNGLITPYEELYETLLMYSGDSLSEWEMPFGFVTEAYYDSIRGGSSHSFGFNTSKFVQLNNLYSADIKNQLTKYGAVFHSTYDGCLSSQSKFYQAIKDLIDTNKYFPDRISSKNKLFEVCSDDADLKLQLASYVARLSNLNTWNNFWNYVKYGYTLDDSYELLKELEEPLVLVPDNIGTKNIYTDISNADALFVSEGDYSKLVSHVNEAFSSGETTYLMRFALRDFYSSDIKIAQSGSSNDYDYGEGNYFFEKKIFEDFDVLSLTWKNEGGGTKVLPVSATPITIVGTPTPPGETTAPESDYKNNDNDKFPWMLVISIVAGAAAIVIIGYFVYTAYFGKPKPFKKSRYKKNNYKHKQTYGNRPKKYNNSYKKKNYYKGGKKR